MALLGALQGIQTILTRALALRLLEKDRHPLAAASHPEQREIEGGVPLPGQACLGHGAVEGQTVPIELSLSQGAVHIPQERLGGQSRHGAADCWGEAKGAGR